MNYPVVLAIFSLVLAASSAVTDAVFTGPEDTNVLSGQTATLPCNDPDFTPPGSTVWREGSLSFANQDGVFRGSTYTKYENFNIENPSTTNLDLIISDAQVSDEGTYMCEISPTPAKMAVLAVEMNGAVPVITLFGDSSGNPIVLRESVVSVLRCTATGYRPPVNLEWYMDNIKLSEDVSEGKPTPSGDTYQTPSNLTISATRSDDGKVLRCQTVRGDRISEPQATTLTLNVQYKPVVTRLTYSDGVITCDADANPITNIQYFIILNGTKPSSPTGQTLAFKTEENYCTEVTCEVTNAIGTGSKQLDNPLCPGYVEPTTTPATKSMPPTKSPPAGQGLGTGAIIGIAVGVLVVVCFVIIGIIICFKKKIFCFDNNKTSNSSTSPKKQPSAKNADMIRNQPEVRQSVHNYDDEPKKPRVPRSNSGKPAAAAAAVPPEKEALRQNPPPHSKDRDHQNYPMDSRDGGPEHGGQAGINYADLEFQNRQGATNGHGRVHPREDEPTQYASILV